MRDSVTATTRALRCNSLTFPVMIWGSERGRAVLLLHGFPQEPATWLPIAEALAQDGFQVFAPCQRGYAVSTRSQAAGDYSFAHFVDDAIAVADALDLNRFDVVGFGMGGVVAWMLAAYQPARVRSLTSLRYPHPAAFAHGIQFEPEQRDKWHRLKRDLDGASLEETAAAMLADNAAGLRRFLSGSGLPEPFLERYVARLQEPDALVGALSWQRAVTPEEFSKVPAVTAPTLLMWSEGPALARGSVEASRGYVHASFTEVLIPNVGNFMLETASAALLPHLRSHLRLN